MPPLARSVAVELAQLTVTSGPALAGGAVKVVVEAVPFMSPVTAVHFASLSALTEYVPAEAPLITKLFDGCPATTVAVVPFVYVKL
jgi:hypothetical protein